MVCTLTKRFLFVFPILLDLSTDLDDGSQRIRCPSKSRMYKRLYSSRSPSLPWRSFTISVPSRIRSRHSCTGEKKRNLNKASFASLPFVCHSIASIHWVNIVASSSVNRADCPVSLFSVIACLGPAARGLYPRGEVPSLPERRGTCGMLT